MNNARRKEIAQLVADMEETNEALDGILATLDRLQGQAECLKDEEQEYFDNMPESLQGSDKGQIAVGAIGHLETIVNCLESANESAKSAVEDFNSSIEAAGDIE